MEDANPFHGIHAAVTRAPREGGDPGWQPAQRMTRDEAVRAFTIWNARSIGREAELAYLAQQPEDQQTQFNPVTGGDVNLAIFPFGALDEQISRPSPHQSAQRRPYDNDFRSPALTRLFVVFFCHCHSLFGCRFVHLCTHR